MISAELQFLAWAVRFATHGGGGGEPVFPPPGLDWDRLVELARRHRCSAMLRATLVAMQFRTVPEPAWRRLESEVMSDAARVAFMQARLAEILALFQAEGIGVMPLKGASLGALAYPDPGLRTFDDLDLMVHPIDFLRAQEVLSAAGYVPAVSLSDWEARAQMRLGWDRSFRSPEGDYAVEICMGIAPRYFSFALKPEDLWRNPQEIQLSGLGIQSPSADDLVLLLCAHGTKHLWSRLVWIADMSGLIRRSGHGIDWNALWRRARGLGGERMLTLALALAGELDSAGKPGQFMTMSPSSMGVSEPGLAVVSGRWGRLVFTERCGPLPVTSRGAQAVWTLIRRVASGLDSLPWQAPPTSVEVRFHLLARERWRDRMRYMFRWAFVPAYGDWRAVRLGSMWRWLYYGVRPLRLGVRLLKGVVR